jgi:hypothetical protein
MDDLMIYWGINAGSDRNMSRTNESVICGSSPIEMDIEIPYIEADASGILDPKIEGWVLVDIYLIWPRRASVRFPRHTCGSSTRHK